MFCEINIYLIKETTLPHSYFKNDSTIKNSNLHLITSSIIDLQYILMKIISNSFTITNHFCLLFHSNYNMSTESFSLYNILN